MPEAHVERTLRLTLDSDGLALEIGLGWQHRITWFECDAVLKFPDRLELVMASHMSLMIRTRDWFRGDEILDAADDFVPAGLLVAVPDNEESDAADGGAAALGCASSLA